jgi:hypothetical protein
MVFVEYLRGAPPDPSFMELGEITHHCHWLKKWFVLLFFFSCHPHLPSPCCAARTSLPCAARAPLLPSPCCDARTTPPSAARAHAGPVARPHARPAVRTCARRSDDKASHPPWPPLPPPIRHPNRAPPIVLPPVRARPPYRRGGRRRGCTRWPSLVRRRITNTTTSRTKPLQIPSPSTESPIPCLLPSIHLLYNFRLLWTTTLHLLQEDGWC